MVRETTTKADVRAPGGDGAGLRRGVRRSWRLLLCLSLLTVAVASCDLLNQLGNAWTTSGMTDPCAMLGAGGDLGAGGAGGDPGAGGDFGVGGADVGAGVGGAPGAGVGAGAGDTSAAVGAGAGPGARPPPRPRGRRSGLGRAVQADCPDLTVPVNVPPPGPQLVGLTTTKLRSIAAQNSIGVGQTGIQQSRTIGLAFENWVLWAMSQLPRSDEIFLSLQRKSKTGGLPASVIPEQVKNSGWWFNLHWFVRKNDPDYEKSSFFEVKAVNGALTLGTSQWQILGLLDVASQSPAGVFTPLNYPRPIVVFTTTSNTTISPLVGPKATALGVGVFQQTVMYDANTNPGNPDLYIQDPNLINPEVFMPTVVHANPLKPLLSPWQHGPLTSPKTPATDLIVPGDPDPAEVDD